MNFKIIVQIIISFLFTCVMSASTVKENSISYFTIGLLEYSPGDWNSDETALSELSKFINNNTNISVVKIRRDNELKIKIGSDTFFKTKYIYMTGHGELRKSGIWQGLKLEDKEVKDLAVPERTVIKLHVARPILSIFFLDQTSASLPRGIPNIE